MRRRSSPSLGVFDGAPAELFDGVVEKMRRFGGCNAYTDDLESRLVAVEESGEAVDCTGEGVECVEEAVDLIGRGRGVGRRRRGVPGRGRGVGRRGRGVHRRRTRRGRGSRRLDQGRGRVDRGGRTGSGPGTRGEAGGSRRILRRASSGRYSAIGARARPRSAWLHEQPVKERKSVFLVLLAWKARERRCRTLRSKP